MDRAVVDVAAEDLEEGDDIDEERNILHDDALCVKTKQTRDAGVDESLGRSTEFGVRVLPLSCD